MKISLYHNRECTAYLKAIEALEEALIDNNFSPIFVIHLIRDDADAKEHKFFGSPTVRINGQDIDPEAEAKEFTSFHANGCRSYMWKGEAYDYPPKEMITDFLKRL